MSVSLDCPPFESWPGLLDESTPVAERERYLQHLESCPACQDCLDQAERCEENFLRIAQRLRDPTEVPGDLTLVDAMDRLHHWKDEFERALVDPPALEFLRPSDRLELLGMLGHYEVQEIIGEGGMGIVLKAFEPALRRLVAIKVMAPSIASSATARRRFIREAKAAAAVSHEHVVAVHGVSEEAGLPYFVMQYVTGESLQTRLDRGTPLEVDEIVCIGLQAARGLAAAHAKGLIHRDVKPANILLGIADYGLRIQRQSDTAPEQSAIRNPQSAIVKITDFGLARMVDDAHLTQNGMVAGTPEYMSPEQARGEAVDHRADLFSLGSVMYAMSTGVPPFRGATALSVLRQVSDVEPVPVRSINPKIHAWLEEFINRLMVKHPAQRPLEALTEVAEFLETCMAHLRDPQKPVRVPDPASVPPKSKHSIVPWLLLALLALAVPALMIGGFPFMRFSTPVRQSFLDVTLGNRLVEGVEESGFYHDEQNDAGPFRWTDGNAKLVIPLARDERPSALFMLLFRPHKNWLRIKVNNQELVNEKVTNRTIAWWAKTIDLSGIDPGDKLVVEFVSNTVVPKNAKPSMGDDSRSLGVRVRGIKLLSSAISDKPVSAPSGILNITPGESSIPGFVESGFHNEERDDRGPFRWTNGTGKVLIPLDKQQPPKALLIQLDRPKNSFLRITVNDRVLVNEPATNAAPQWWEKALGLDGIDLREKLAVAIDSNTSVSTKDARVIGVQVRGFKLLLAKGGEKAP